MHVLVVDDDPAIRRLLAFALKLEGHRVGLAEDGADALVRAEAALPDVAIVDLAMPQMDGATLIEGMRQRWGRRIRVLVLSGSLSVADQARAARADDYMTKPFDVDSVLDRVQALGLT